MRQAPMSEERRLRLQELLVTARCGDVAEGIDCVAGLVDMLEVVKPRSVLEVGCDRGVSTETFLLHCDRVVALDPWELLEDWRIERWETFQRNCVDRYIHLQVVKGFSPGALLQFADEDFDLVYIDAVHQYQPLIDDVFATYRLVKRDGWIAGHDYCDLNAHDVKPAVDDMFGTPDHVFSDGSWLVRKRPPKEPPLERKGLLFIGGGDDEGSSGARE
jgi:predicted O-methyltransferase YrrM